jgi:hypothetical protein
MADPLRDSTPQTAVSAPTASKATPLHTEPSGHSGHDSALSLADTIHDSSHQEEDTADSNDEQEDDGIDDGDSAFGGSLIGCDTDTLASYITDYRYENGRRYHAYRDGEYWVECLLFSTDTYSYVL